MKFNKFILGLAAVPLLLVSCSNSLTYEQTRDWVIRNYTHKIEETHPAFAVLAWDYHATTGEHAKALIKNIFEALNDFAEQDSGYTIHDVIAYPGDDAPTIGEKIVISKDAIQEVPPLCGTSFEHFGKVNKDGAHEEDFKVIDNKLTITYKNDLPIVNPVGMSKIEDMSFVRAFDSEGYITGYGAKIGRLFIDSNNIVKLKVTVNFTYSR